MRVLHLLEPGSAGHEQFRSHGSDLSIVACRSALQACPEVDHSCVVVGNGAAARSSDALGIPARNRLPNPAGAPELAWRALRLWARQRPAFDVVHAWTPRAARLARLALEGTPVCWTDLDGKDGSEGHVLRLTNRNAPGGSGRGRIDPRSLVSRIEADGAGLLPPRDGRLVIGLLGDPPAAVDARRAVWFMGLLEIAGLRVMGVVPACSRELARARRFRHLSGLDWPLVRMEAPAIASIASWDAAMLDTDRSRAASPGESWRAAVALAHLHGVPVLAPLWAGDSDLYPAELRDRCLADNAGVPALAARALALLRDRAGLAQASDAVRKFIESNRRQGDLADTCRELWSDAMRDVPNRANARSNAGREGR